MRRTQTRAQYSYTQIISRRERDEAAAEQRRQRAAAKAAKVEANKLFKVDARGGDGDNDDDDDENDVGDAAAPTLDSKPSFSVVGGVVDANAAAVGGGVRFHQLELAPESIPPPK